MLQSCCLCLLLLLTPLDDVAALATPDTDDDARATQNNDFLPRDRAEQPGASCRQAAEPCPGGVARPAAAGQPLRRPSAAPAAVPSGPDLLYVFMSLRR